jgi:hypothetical protein
MNRQPTQKSRVLELTLKDCQQTHALTLEILRAGDYLRYELHNCDIQNDRLYFFVHDLFPLAFVEIQVSKTDLDYTLLDSVRSTDYTVPELRMMTLEVEVAKKGIIASFEDPIAKIRLKQENQEDIVIDYGDEPPSCCSLFMRSLSWIPM